MSYTEIGQLTALSGGVISLNSGHSIVGQPGSIVAPGNVIQTQYVRVDTRPTYYCYNNASANNQMYTAVRALNLPFRPMYANSMVLVKFVINGEMTHDTVWSIMKDEQMITRAQGEAFPNRWNGMAFQNYDRDDSSTPSQTSIMWMDIPGTTDMVTYSPGFRRSNGNDVTFYLNRCVSSSGQDSYEATVSFGVAMEIAQ